MTNFGGHESHEDERPRTRRSLAEEAARLIFALPGEDKRVVELTQWLMLDECVSRGSWRPPSMLGIKLVTDPKETAMTLERARSVLRPCDHAIAMVLAQGIARDRGILEALIHVEVDLDVYPSRKTQVTVTEWTG